MTVNSGISLGSCMRHSGQRHTVSRGTSLNTDLLFLVRAAGEACCCAQMMRLVGGVSYHIISRRTLARCDYCTVSFAACATNKRQLSARPAIYNVVVVVGLTGHRTTSEHVTRTSRDLCRRLTSKPTFRTAPFSARLRRCGGGSA